MINQIKLYHLRKKAALPDCIIVNNNLSVKLNVWGGISKRGPTPFVTFNNNMNRFGYQEIIIRYLWPFSIQRYQGRCYVHQDNDSKHASRLCMSTRLIIKTRLCGVHQKKPMLGVRVSILFNNIFRQKLETKFTKTYLLKNGLEYFVKNFSESVHGIYSTISFTQKCCS
jgi:hypothetical protein